MGELGLGLSSPQKVHSEANYIELNRTELTSISGKGLDGI